MPFGMPFTSILRKDSLTWAWRHFFSFFYLIMNAKIGLSFASVNSGKLLKHYNNQMTFFLKTNIKLRHAVVAAILTKQGRK